MKGSQGKMSIQGGPFIEMYWREIIILHHRHQLGCGLKQGGEAMKKSILLIGILDGKRSRMLFHIMIHSFGEADKYNEIETFLELNSEMAIIVLTTVMIMDS